VALPHFEIDERPKPLRVIGFAGYLFLQKPVQEIRLEEATGDRAFADNVVVQQRSELPRNQRASGTGKPILVY